MDEKVIVALKRIPLLEGMAIGSMNCARLGGLTNLVYRLEVGAERYVLRIPGEGTEDYIDRKVEGHNARVAADAPDQADRGYIHQGSCLRDKCLPQTRANQTRRHRGLCIRRIHRQ